MTGDSAASESSSSLSEGIVVVSATRPVTEDGNAINVWEFEAGEGVGSKFPVAVGNIWISNEEPIVS